MMESMNVRKVDIVQILPFVERLAFLETRAERAAREMSLTIDFILRKEQTETPMFTYEPPSWKHWFGRFISEPAVIRK